MVAGFTAGVAFPSSFTHLLSGPIRQLAGIVRDSKAHSVAYIFWTILSHNLWVALTLVVFGVVFGLWPAFTMWTNGLLTGFVVRLGADERHVAVWKMVVFGILPHGIFELPAFVLAAAIGMANGYAFARILFGQFTTTREGSSRRSLILKALLRTARGFAWTLGMLLIAAVIETFVTPHLLSFGLHRAIGA